MARRSDAVTGDLSELLAIGDEVRRCRQAAHLTQEELALAAGVSRDFVIALENGRPRCALGKSARLLATLGLRLFAGAR